MTRKKQVETVEEHKRHKLKARTQGQQYLIDTILNKKVVFVTGPAGAGKTACAIGVGIESVLKQEYNRLVLVRPVAEAGEYLGALPGNLEDKVGVHYTPFFDELHHFIHHNDFKQYLQNAKAYKWPGIEIAPLAYLRGRSLNNCFIVLDEAQNCTTKQLKMVLTRLGKDSKLVISGDVKQSDINNSGLSDVIKNLKDIRDIGFVSLLAEDIQRDPIIGKILERI